jgi:hypothetical protein
MGVGGEEEEDVSGMRIMGGKGKKIKLVRHPLETESQYQKR